MPQSIIIFRQIFPAQAGSWCRPGAPWAVDPWALALHRPARRGGSRKWGDGANGGLPVATHTGDD